MNQSITITIDGLGGIVRPDVALKVLELVFQTLQSIDANSWAIGHPRLNWRVADAAVKNPLTFTYQGEPISPSASSLPDIGNLFITGCRQIQEGIKPAGFTHEDIRRMAELGRHSRQLRTLEFSNTKFQHKVLPAALAEHASQIMEHPQRVDSYGSIEGTLVAMTNYPDKKSAAATLLIRMQDQKVVCQLTPKQAEELNDYVDRRTRVVLFGQINYEDAAPKRMKVESYRVIEEDQNLPTLEDIRRLKLGPPKGQTIEDYISEIRGEDD